MEIIFFIGIFVFLWISIGFGVRELFRVLNHYIWDFPLLVILWPLFLLIVAYYPSYTKGKL